MILGKRWHKETPEVRLHYKELADECKRKHQEKYPNYRYTPRKPNQVKRRAKRSKPAEEANPSVEDLLHVPALPRIPMEQVYHHPPLPADYQAPVRNQEDTYEPRYPAQLYKVNPHTGLNYLGFQNPPGTWEMPNYSSLINH